MNFVENLVDGDRLLPVLLQDLHSAARSIHIAIFLFFDEPIGEEISGVLEAKGTPGLVGGIIPPPRVRRRSHGFRRHRYVEG